ncbi:hypothetical protein RRG08_001707 [Elysia crispata]|uniref:Uncharacterized protein n=1 Tax=Elysia crispata TaxID=231223 RepID=A0AAE1E0A6_9GAST|nr:hypothetical protein RRG08_001707 [Elysia crispata]
MRRSVSMENATFVGQISPFVMAKRQYNQYLLKKKDLKEGELIATLDFAENFQCNSQDEAESVYESYQQAMLHPIVIN